MVEKVNPQYMAKFGSELLVTPANPLLPQTKINFDSLPWVGYLGPGEDEPTPYVFTKTLVDPDSGNFCMVVRLEPDAPGPAHWHTSDTVYIPIRGELHVAGEQVYRVGDIRWVKGGTAYSGEVPGPDGCEFIFLSLGPYGFFDPAVDEPPLGWGSPPADS